MIIIIIFYTFILPILSIKYTKPKICINCKFFRPDYVSNIYGKCSLFPDENGKLNLLVSGVNEKNYIYCSTARNHEDMCGEKGRLYKRKYIKK
jgi:hypothetical protein